MLLYCILLFLLPIAIGIKVSITSSVQEGRAHLHFIFKLYIKY